MKLQQIKCIVCAVVWTATFAMAIGGSLRNELPMMFWSGILALIGCLIAGHLIAEGAARRACREERVRLETLAQIVVEKARENVRSEAGIPTIPRPRS